MFKAGYKFPSPRGHEGSSLPIARSSERSTRLITYQGQWLAAQYRTACLPQAQCQPKSHRCIPGQPRGLPGGAGPSSLFPRGKPHLLQGGSWLTAGSFARGDVRSLRRAAQVSARDMMWQWKPCWPHPLVGPLLPPPKNALPEPLQCQCGVTWPLAGSTAPPHCMLTTTPA